MKLNEKSIIVTGATSGMGMAMAEIFVREGAFVILSGRDLERGLALEKKAESGR
ncbi:SDR family NAD(P)-dependent oxidoreductase [Algoriphagus boritolerans]|uniref:SDR family NAD(P)-dependent oxidoreductase n=1 Tax=Algoriphagus boritolerans TaxID=308111 RepID=UPI000A7D6FA5